MSNAKIPKTLTTDQQEQLLVALLRKDAPPKTARKGFRNYLIGCLMLDAGLRVGEVVSLKLSHLYFNSLPVANLFLTSDVTKNGRERTVPVSARLADALRNYFSNFLLVDVVNDSEYAFYVTDPMHPLTTRQVENVFFTAGTKAFGRQVNPHMLRHTFASRLLRVTNMRTVQELLGHNFITSTQIYTHPNADDKKKAIDDLETKSNHDVQDFKNLSKLAGQEMSSNETCN